MTTAFDPTDKKYQVSPEFPPDKESSWPFPAENDGKHASFYSYLLEKLIYSNSDREYRMDGCS